MHSETRADARTAPTSQSRLRSIIGGSIGNLVEWYDWYAYSAFSLYFSKAFFPPANQTVQLLNAAAVFAVGFFVRPLGGWIMGRYADKHGRRAALTLSVLLMCAGSLLIAVTPGYAVIGAFAPAALVFARMVQGLSVGGEYGASATYLSEMAGQKHRGFWSSFQYVTLIGGQLLALSVLLILQRTLTAEELTQWGWRVPFVVGALCALVAIRLRRSLEETSDFQHEASDARTAKTRATLRGLAEHPRAVATVVGLTAGGALAFYTFTTYAQKFLVNTAGFTAKQATFVNAVTLTVYMLLQPVIGALSDRVGRRPVLMAFGLIGAIGTVPLLRALGGATSEGEAIMLLLCALTVLSGYTAINAVVKAELFPTSIRALGVGFPYAVTVSIFGGTAEYVALWFKNAGHEEWFYWYVSACIAGSFIVYATMKESSRIGHMGE